jgi:YD repeat-containing protein
MRDVYDRFGNRTRVRYDASNRVEWIDDPYSFTQALYTSLVFSYGANGQLASIRDNLGSSSHWRYTNVTVNSSGWLTQITDPDGKYTTFGYDGSGRLQTIIDRRGYTTTLAYDDAQSKKLATITAPATYIEGQGTVAPVTSLANWQKVSVPYASTSGTPFTPIAIGNVKGSVTDPETHVTSFTVNKWGQPVVTTDALNRNTTTSYDANGLPLSIQHPTGGTDAFTYNGDGLPTQITPAGMTATDIQYGAWAQPTLISGTGQETRQFFLGANGRVDSVKVGSGAGHVTRYRYDNVGRDTLVTDPATHQVARKRFQGTYGNLSELIEPGGRTTTYGYDLYGRTTTVAQTGMPTRTTHYDKINRPDTVWDGVNALPTRYEYDIPGSDGYTAVRVTDPKGQVYVEFRTRWGGSPGVRIRQARGIRTAFPGMVW